MDFTDLDRSAPPATNVVAKDIFAVTETGAAVRVMCNSTAVSAALAPMKLRTVFMSFLQIQTDVGFKCWDGLFIRTRAGL